jgi:hypothetical protein
MNGKIRETIYDADGRVLRPLPRWQHPTLVWIILVLLVGASVESLLLAPSCIQAAAVNQRAEDAYKRNDLINSEKAYRQVLKLKPKADHARLGLMLSLFKQHDHQKDLEAVTYIKDTVMTKDNKVDLINAMPAQYRPRVTDPYADYHDDASGSVQKPNAQGGKWRVTDE